MDMDALLMQELGKFIQCSHHALYFPTTHAPRQPELLPRERRLLLPLYRQGSLLGVLMLHGVKVRDARLLLPQLPAIADLCLELLARVKATRVDAVTGLATENVLYGSMEDEAARVREIFADPSRGDGQSSPLHRLCMGLVLLHFSNGREIVGRMGFRFADELMRRAAEALQEELPSDVVAARVGRFGMALLLPSVSGRSACQKMAEAALARMAGAAMPAPLTGRTIRPRLSAGHAVYPQDMEGAELRLPMFEQARMLMERARLAARMTSQPGAPRVMPFARILQDGGTVLRALPQGRVRVGLGAQAKAREGMRFAVWGPSGQEGSGNQYKGEVVLLQVREFHSVAETVHLADATAPLEAGDRLSLLEVPSLAASHPHTPGGKTAAADASGTPGQEGTAAADKETEEASAAGSVQEVRARIPVLEDGSCAGIYGHGDFLHLFAQEKERTGRFVLAIVRVDVPHDARQEAALGECLAAWRQIPELCAGEPLAGLYGSNALIFFHADSSAETLLPHYAALCTRLEGAGLPVSAGLAGYPLLHYRKGEMPDCALKALEYAQLLPSPRAGLCNSLALNISADRRYALGDVFGAIDEYKLALVITRPGGIFWRPCATRAMPGRNGRNASPRPITIWARSASNWASAVPRPAITGNASRTPRNTSMPICVWGSCARRADVATRPGASMSWPPPSRTGRRSRPGNSGPALPGAIWPGSRPGSGMAARPANCCTIPCCAILSMPRPCSCWPACIWTATRIRPWPSCWPARAWACATRPKAGRYWPGPCAPWAVKRKPAWPRRMPPWASNQAWAAAEEGALPHSAVCAREGKGTPAPLGRCRRPGNSFSGRAGKEKGWAALPLSGRAGRYFSASCVRRRGCGTDQPYRAS